MAYDTRTFSSATTSDATFRTWGSGISASLIACGLVQTSDTGQIDWTTVIKPTAAATIAGYEIFRFNDTLQSTAPIFIKLEYSTAPASASYSGLWLQVGTSSNGSGTIGGQVSTRTMMYSGANTGSFPTYTSGGSGYISQWSSFVTTASSGNMFFVVERLRNSSGVTTDAGYFVLTSSGGQSAPTHQTVPTTGAIMSQQARPIWPQQLGSGVYGTDIYYSTLHPFNGQILNPAISVLGYYSTDVPTTPNQTILMFGTNRTYRPLGTANTNLATALLGQSLSSILMLWE